MDAIDFTVQNVFVALWNLSDNLVLGFMLFSDEEKRLCNTGGSCSDTPVLHNLQKEANERLEYLTLLEVIK